MVLKKNKRISKIKKSLQKYEQDILNYQNSLINIKSINDANGYLTIDEDSEHDEKKEQDPSHNKNFTIFSHCFLNEKKTHLHASGHPQKIYHSMIVRK